MFFGPIEPFGRSKHVCTVWVLHSNCNCVACAATLYPVPMILSSHEVHCRRVVCRQRAEPRRASPVSCEHASYTQRRLLASLGQSALSICCCCCRWTQRRRKLCRLPALYELYDLYSATPPKMSLYIQIVYPQLRQLWVLLIV